MRLAVVCGIALVGLGTPAMGADMPVLRGSQVIEPGVPSYFRWDGAYYAVQAGYASGSANIGMPLFLPPTTGKGASASLGAFVGYNAQWDEAVLGVELNYNHNFFSFSSDFDAFGSPAHANVDLSDYMTFRLRAGWAAGDFMPYGFFAIAGGYGDIKRSVNFVPIDDRIGILGSGYAMGLGVDWMYHDFYFMRAEYEYTRFMSFHGTDVNFFTIRTAIGVRF